MNKSVLPQWNLNDIYSGSQLEEDLVSLEKLTKELMVSIELNDSSISVDTASEILNKFEKAEYYCYCISIDANFERSYLFIIQQRIASLKSQVRDLLISYKQHLVESEFKNDNFNKSIQSEIDRFISQNSGLRNKEIVDLTMDSVKAWEDLYIHHRNNILIMDTNGDLLSKLSFGKANQLSMNHHDSLERNRVFKLLNTALQQNSSTFAIVLNQSINFRLKKYSLPLSNDPALNESLRYNGISESVIDAMWKAVDEALPLMKSYMDLKAKELSVEQLTWHQLMTSSHQLSKNENVTFSFPDAIDQIVKALQVYPGVDRFVIEAVSNGWIDAAPSDTKPPGGFCVPFINENQSRISISFDGTLDSIRILAHELGHAWHFKQLTTNHALSFLEERLEMTVAETASIFFETTWINYLKETTQNIELKRTILNRKIQSSLNYLMSVRASFEFEKQLYQLKQEGRFIDAEQLEELSINTQKKAFGNSLSEYQPFVWMKYVHFYLAELPFYNYPYSFGYLFSLGLLENYQKDKQTFHARFNKFLSLTGTLRTEELAKKQFDIDLTDLKFWRQSVKSVVADIEEYISLSQ